MDKETRSGGRRFAMPQTSGLWAAAAGLALMLGIAHAPGAAGEPASNIVIDGSLPGTRREGLSGPDYQIPASKGSLSGSNLFFSFERFGLDLGESATFSGPDSVTRILSRVTGRELSRIDGVLRSEIDGASLYLINPNGIVLGENASLDVPGAFHATTADFLLFEDGGEFHARFPERDSPLSMEPIAAFGFLSADPASITLDGSQLISGSIANVPVGGRLASGEAFALIGGDIEILGGPIPDATGYVFTGGSRLDIASLDSPGRVRIVNVDPMVPGSREDLVVESDGSTPLRLGQVRVAEGAALVTGGPPPVVGLEDTFVNGSGNVFVRAHDLTLENAEIRAITTTARQAGRIDVELKGDLVADGLGLNQTTGLVAGSGLTIDRQDPRVPTPNVITNELFFPEGRAIIRVLSDAQNEVVRIEHPSQGDGGEIHVRAENVSLLRGAKLSSSSFYGGDGGSISVEAGGRVRIAGTREDGTVAGIFSNAQLGGNSGSISVASESLELDELGGLFGEVSGGAGVGGSIDVDVSRLLIEGSGRIDTTTRGSGPGGRISIDASEWIRLSGRADDFNFSSVTTFSLEEGSGSAGTLIIRSPEIQLQDGAGISTSALGEGDGGVIDLRAESVELSSSSVTSSADLGTAGDIYLNGGPLAPGSLEIEKPSGVESGRILILDESTISTSATEGFGRGGDIVIDPEFVVLRESQIIARAVGGEGGNIVIVTDQLVSDLNSLINADSQFSTDGNVVIDTTGQQLRGDVAALPATLRDAVALLRERCSARRSGASAASFVLRGRDGLPHSPEDYLPAFHDLEEPDPGRVALLSVPDPASPVELVLGCRALDG